MQKELRRIRAEKYPKAENTPKPFSFKKIEGKFSMQFSQNSLRAGKIFRDVGNSFLPRRNKFPSIMEFSFKKISLPTKWETNSHIWEIDSVQREFFSQKMENFSVHREIFSQGLEIFSLKIEISYKPDL